MRLLPRSVYGRLLALSLLVTAAALVFAGVAIGGILERFVMAGLDDRLDAELNVLAGAVRSDGTIEAGRAVVAPPYDDPASGWSWRIDAPRARRSSSGEAIADMPAPPALPAPPLAPLPPDRAGSRPQAFDWRDANDQRRHARRVIVETAAGPATVVAAAPRRIVERPIRAALVPLLGSLAALGLALALASLIQLRIGLRPLARLRIEVAAVRNGSAERLLEDHPVELAPLAAELNAVLAQNAVRLAQARGHVANLAHGLKTPLATLSLGLRKGGDKRLGAEVARMERSIRHHLGRARADAGGAATRTLVALAPAVTALAQALARIHADRGIAFDSEIPSGAAVALDPQDLDELLGNLLDNAWRWARAQVTLRAAGDGAMVRMTIADDGPGIPPAARAEAMTPGRRLDESGDGHGFGLSIARELTELYGGLLSFDETAGGGLTIDLLLPGRA